MNFKNLPFRQSFSSVVKPVVSKEKDELLAIASLNELSHFIPNIDASQHIDLLPIAFNACVVNRVNKNGDVINTETALAIYKNFINKFIDTEHNRQKVIGVILTSSLSEFGTDKPLTESEVIGTDRPFNITLGGVVWKAVNENLCDLIEESNDPTSEHYLNIAASWELGFSGYKIIELEAGEKNLVNPVEITDPEHKETIKKYLKCFGGVGVKDGKNYYRMPHEDVIPMGVALTEKPAADVVGVAINKTETNASISEVNASSSEENISHLNKNNVNQERITIMKITSIQDITDENLKQCTASAVTEFIASEIKKASEVYATEKAEKEDMHKKLQSQHEELSKSVAQMQDVIAALNKEKEERVAMDTFNARMGEVCGKYDLPHDVAKVVAEDVKSCANEDMYATWQSKAEALLRPYLKKAKAEDMEVEASASTENNSETKVEKTEESKASVEQSKEEIKEEKKEEAIANVVEEVLDNAKEEKAGVPNTSSASAPGLKERFQAAFAEENFVIKL
jgi:hypothetical protein